MDIRSVRRLSVLAFAVYLLLEGLPFVLLVQDGGISFPGIGSRQMGLLYQSVYIGILAGLGSAFMGTVIALFLREWGHKIGRLKYFYILWAPVPPYIYALCYMQLQRELGQHYRELLGIKMVGAAPVILVEILAYIPICTLIMSRAIQNINQEELSLAVLYGTGNRALLRVVIPKLVPVFLAVSGCVFALSVTDFSIPSLFQVQVYATEIFSGYSADGMFRKAAALSLPLILVSAVVFLVLCGGMGSLRFRQAGKGAMNLRLTGAVKCMVGLGGVIGFLQFFIPVVSLFMGYSGLTGMVKTIKSFHTEFYHSIILALIAGAVCIFPSMAAGFVAFKKNYVCVLCMLFLTVPGALISIGTLQLANRLLGGTGLYRSILIPGLV